MSDHIHTDAVTDGLPILVELAHYPDALNGAAGNALAALLSEVASAIPATSVANPAVSRTLLIDAEREVDDLRVLLFAQPPNPAARQYAVRLAATAIALVADLDARKPTATAAREAEVTRWLRQTIGQAMGRTGEAAILAVTPRMLVSALLVAPQMDSLETSIRMHWGISLVIGVTDTVAAVAAAIVNSMQRSAA